MTEDEARNVELVRAVELEDRELTLLTREDREQAQAHARRTGADAKVRSGPSSFLAARAEFAASRLATRHPGIGALVRRSKWPGWLGWAVPLMAFVAGFAANEFGTGKRLDLLAVPLLGTIAWNFLVYAWLLVAMFQRRDASGRDPLYRALLKARGFGRDNPDLGTSLQRAGAAFKKRWAAASASLTGARIERTLHLSAALFACGLIGGIFLRALVIEYYAGWESTFLGPEAVRALLSMVLGPASWMTGVTLPSTAGIAAMRWTGPTSGGVNAAPWIILYTTTVVGLVVVPRLLLGLGQAGKALYLARRFPVPGREDFYVRRLLRNAGGTRGRVRITPYAYRPGNETRRRLSGALRGALGDVTEVHFDEAVDYGDEDDWNARNAVDPDDDYHILLFTLSATPEEENHGAFATALAKRVATERSGIILAAVIDEAPFRAHFTGQGDLAERVASRIDAWRVTLAGAGVAPIALDLSEEADPGLAQHLESGLMPDGEMRG